MAGLSKLSMVAAGCTAVAAAYLIYTMTQTKPAAPPVAKAAVAKAPVATAPDVAAAAAAAPATKPVAAAKGSNPTEAMEQLRQEGKSLQEKEDFPGAVAKFRLVAQMEEDADPKGSAHLWTKISLSCLMLQVRESRRSPFRH